MKNSLITGARMPEERMEESVEEVEVEEAQESKFNLSGIIAKILFYLAGALVLIFLMFAVAWGVRNWVKPEEAISRETQLLSEFESKPPITSTYRFESLKFNLDPQNETDNYTTIVQVQIDLAYEYENESVQDELAVRHSELVDKMQYIMARQKFSDIDTVKERETILKRQLLTEVKKLSRPEHRDKIFDVYFIQFNISRAQI